MAELGHDVLAVDTDPSKINLLRTGRAPFFEPHLDEVLQRNIAAGRLHFSTSYDAVGTWGAIHFICVGTPQLDPLGTSDLSQIRATIDALSARITVPSVILGKSTVPVGTARHLIERIKDTASAEADIELAWNPEFLREGHAVRDTLSPTRIVLGTENRTNIRAERLARTIYRLLLARQIPMVVTDLETAELTKTAANSFLATKISFINAMAELCDAAGADVSVLADALGYDPRIGRMHLGAGLGYGGGCLPKDLHALVAKADELGIVSIARLLHDVEQINLRARARTTHLAIAACGGTSRDRSIAVLGAAFKPGTDDIRNSPALDVAEDLRRLGATVTVFDPQAMSKSRNAFPELKYARSTALACRNADAILVLTDWPEFSAMLPGDLEAVVRGKAIVDGRNCLDPLTWRAAGWSYSALGRMGFSGSTAERRAHADPDGALNP